MTTDIVLMDDWKRWTDTNLIWCVPLPFNPWKPYTLRLPRIMHRASRMEYKYSHIPELNGDLDMVTDIYCLGMPWWERPDFYPEFTEEEKEKLSNLWKELKDINNIVEKKV